MSKNADYWRGRFSMLEDAAFNQSEQTIQNIEQMYMDAQLSIQKEIEAWYGRFAANNGISLAEARKWLNTGQLEEFRWTVDQYIEAGKKAGLDPTWLKQLENASAKVHVSRLEALQMQIQQKVELLNGNQVDSIDAMLKKVVGGNYTHTAYEIQKGLGVGWDVTGLDQRKLETLISRPWTTDGRTFRDRCWVNKQALVDNINTNLVQGLLRGDSPEKAIQALQKQFGVSRYKARRLVHTETAYFNACSTREVYKDLDIEKIEILETLDSRTCDICGGLDGQVITLAQYEPGVTVPPFHPNCRGTTCPYYDDMDGERAARNEDGEVYYVPENMTYKDWKAAFVDGGDKGELKPVVDVQTIRDKVTAKEAEIKTLQDRQKALQPEMDKYQEIERQYGKYLPMSDEELAAYRKQMEDELNFSQMIRLDDYERWRATSEAANFQKRYADFSKQYYGIKDEIRAAQAELDSLKIELTNAENGAMMKIAGVERGLPMSFDDADTGKVNPNYGTDRGYSINCQSCVVTFEARQRGFDVQVLPNTKGSVPERLSYKTNLAWIDPATGKNPAYIYDETATSPKKMLAFLQDQVKQDGRYTIEFSWKGRSRSGHIVNLDRSPTGELRIKDNQRGPRERSLWVGDQDVLAYLGQMKYTGSVYGMKYYAGPKLLRIDGMNFDLSIVDQIMEGVVK